MDAYQLEDLAAAFTVLGRLHQQSPDEESLASLHSLLPDWPLPSTPSTSQGLAHLRVSQEESESAAAIRADHARLYGYTAVATVSPYESVHRGRDGLVFDEQTLQVRDAYRSISLRAPQYNREPDDHIGLELDFMAQSCVKALDALGLESVSDAQRYVAVGQTFFAEHLTQWAPDMLDKATAMADTQFMKGICQLTVGAMEQYSLETATTA